MTEQSFEEQLQKLVREASANGVDVEGAWVCDAAASDERWEVLITRVNRNTE